MFKQSHRLWAIASALALTPWLAACGGLFDTERPAARTYWLTPVAEVSAPAPKPRIPEPPKPRKVEPWRADVDVSPSWALPALPVSSSSCFR